jgi:predicted kinase
VELVIFVGVQASGKSSFFKERFASTHAHVSLDVLKTRHREKTTFLTYLEEGKSIVVDNTNPTRFDRERYVPFARERGYAAHAYWFDTPLEDALARNRGREGKARVPDHAVLRTHKAIEMPTIEEGFARVIRVRLGPDGFEVTDAQ